MDKKIKVLFLVPHPLEGASYRYRVHQFLPYLKRNGIDYAVRPFFSENFYKILYKKRHFLKKLIYTLKGTLGRCADLFRLPAYDIIFIHLESLPFPVLPIEYVAKLLKKPLIFDFDDAIFLKRENATHALRNLLRSHTRTPKMISLSSHVIVCNTYLKDFARRHTSEKNITVLPTVIDTDRFPVK